uniref:DUF659 domain-containing protein n=1 Tax=Phaseolus vulgaris TaxID=3885 RepID=V7AG67_PHAVU|nr:hypothetical protein PHAVU_011G105000g [Phaseolus vulgaris]ESW04554.1 hypothetical protein PHAVU_011G105000g [Phaseolus vulgaris]
MEKKVKCNYCSKIFNGGIFRFKHHLAGTRYDSEPCVSIPEEIKDLMLKVVSEAKDASLKKRKFKFNSFGQTDGEEDNESISSKMFKSKSSSSDGVQATLNQMYKRGDKEKVDAQVAEFFYTSAIPFNVIRKTAFVKMCDMIGRYGVGYKPSTYHDIREKLLKQGVDRTDIELEEYKDEWKRTGCTIMSDGWTDKKRRSICNFLVNSPKGTVFLYSLDTSDISKTADKVFKMLDDAVEFVGEENVLQVVTDNAANFKAGGELLMQKREHLYWTPCAAHSCLYEMKTSLMTMFNSEEWKTSKFGTSQEGRKVQNVVLDIVAPLMVVLRLVDSDVKPAMGFIYEGMDCAKEKIKSNFSNIKKRWINQLHRPLHAAYYLNPQLHYQPNFRNDDAEVKEGLYMCMRRLVNNVAERTKINLQLTDFHHARGIFSLEDAKLGRKGMLPADWWEMFGDRTPELMRFVVRVHTKRRNCLHQKKMNDLVYVMYNSKLRNKQIRRSIALPFEDIQSNNEWITEEGDNVVEVEQTILENDGVNVDIGGGTSLNDSIPDAANFDNIVFDDDVDDEDDDDEHGDDEDGDDHEDLGDDFLKGLDE